MLIEGIVAEAAHTERVQTGTVRWQGARGCVRWQDMQGRSKEQWGASDGKMQGRSAPFAAHAACRNAEQQMRRAALYKSGRGQSAALHKSVSVRDVHK